MQKYCEVLVKDTVFLDISVKNKEEILDLLSANLFELGRISSKELFMKDVYLRENEGETGIEEGLAIPHGKSDFVLKTSLSVARLQTPIEWETLDGNPVTIIILFAVPNGEHANTEHISLLAKVAGNLVNTKILNILKTCIDKDTIIKNLIS